MKKKAIEKIPYFLPAEKSFEDFLAEGGVEFIAPELWERYYETVLGERLATVPSDNLNLLYTPLCGTGNKPVRTVLGRIGVNVNQIAHWANANEHITAEQVAELRASFDRIERLLGDLFANKRTAGKDV